jgi:hypothetical protein
MFQRRVRPCFNETASRTLHGRRIAEGEDTRRGWRIAVLISVCRGQVTPPPQKVRLLGNLIVRSLRLIAGIAMLVRV